MGNITVIKCSDKYDYTIMSKSIIFDQNLSLSSIGLMGKILYLDQSGQELSLKNMLSLSLDGKTKIKSSLKELSDNGYIEVKKIKNKITAIIL